MIKKAVPRAAGRGLQPRPPLRGGNVSDRSSTQDLTLRTGLQTPSGIIF
jgi:hypothetical protein